jgi:hypothetical protein
MAKGRRGLPGGTTLGRLLAERRGRRSPRTAPPLTAGQVRAWAKAHRARTGDWPHSRSGPVEGAVDETWHNLDVALCRGSRGLPACGGLARLLGRPRKRPWTPEEEALVRALPAAEVAARTGRTLPAVLSRRHLLGVGRRRRWTAAEDRLVRKLPPQEAARRIGCSMSAVYTRRHQLRVPDGRSRRT